MSEWKETTIEYTCKDILTGGTPLSSVKEYYENGNIPWLKTKEVNFNRIFSTENYINTNGLENSSAKLIPSNSVIVAMYGQGDTAGRVAINKIPLTTNQACCNLIIDENKANHEFIYYFLSNSYEELVSRKTGSAQPNLNTKLIKDFPVLLPPLENQKSIAFILSSLDDKIDLLHRQNATLEKMAETLFRQWFVEEAKEDWEEKTLGDFVSIKHGFAFKGEYISPEPTNKILVTPGNFKIGGGFKSDKFKYYSKEDFPKEYIFNAGDLIVTMTDLSVDGDTLGYSALVPANFKDEIFLHNQRVGKVEFKKSISKFFLYYLMKTEDYQWYILSGASGTSIRHTSPTSICSYCFSLPTKDKLIEFETICSSWHEKIRVNQTQIRTLTALRDTLLPKLMSGEVRVENDV